MLGFEYRITDTNTGAAAGGSNGVLTAETLPDDGPDVLPIRSTLLALRVEHFDTISGPETAIIRRVERPEACKLCPRSLCKPEGGVCVVRVKAFVPDELCPGYTVTAVAATERLAGLGIKGG